MKTSPIALTLCAALLAGAALPALARGGHGDCDGPRAEAMQKRMGEHFAKRQADLKAQLKLSPEQEAAWVSYTGAVQPPMARQGAQRPDRAEMEKLSTPQRLEKMQALKAERDTHMAKVVEATKAFYATLTPEQQKVFDAQHMRHPMGGHGQGEHGRRGHQGMHG
jgi:hypothetical protein